MAAVFPNGMFGIGDELSFDKLRRVGKNVLTMSLIEGPTTWIFISLTFLFIGFKPINAFIIGSIGIATAPAATFVIMNKLGVGGRLRNLLGGIVVLDDVIEIFIFSIMTQIALILKNDSFVSIKGLLAPVTKEMAFAVLLGGVIFVILPF